MTYKKMLLLAALLVGLALYITKIELANDEIKIATEQPLVTYPPQAFLEVSVAGPKGNFTLVNANPKTELKKEGAAEDSLSVEDAAQWKLRDVQGGEVDRGALNTLIAALRNLKLENALTAEDTDKDLGVYGLTKPELSVEVKVAAINRTLQLGKLNEFVKKRYLKDSQSPSIYLASDELFNAASKSASDIRDHLPLKLDDAKLTKFSLETVAGKIIIERDGEKWKIA